MGVKLKGISTVDGRTVEVDVSDLKESNVKFISTLIRYTYNTFTTPPPNSAQLRANSTVATDITTIWVHRSDYDNRDNKFWLMQLKAGGQLYVQDMNNSDSRAVYTLLEDPIDEGDYLTFNVECDYVSGTPLEGTGILIGIFA